MELHRRPRRALQPRRSPRQPRAEPDPAARRARRSAGALRGARRATASPPPNAGLVTDIIACPGLDYCALANARSIPIAQRISERFADHARQKEIGELKIKISGCINACGHHHVGHIGILGVEKKGEEFYQLTLGGSGDETASVGEIIGPGFSIDDVVDAVETVVDTYLKVRAGPGRELPRRLSPARPGAVQGGALWRRLTRSPSPSTPDAGIAGRGRGAERALRRPRRPGRHRARRRRAVSATAIALVSSFGAEFGGAPPSRLRGRPQRAGDLPRHRPAVRRDAGVPRRCSTERLGLTDVRTVTPDPARLAAKDPHRALWMTNPDLCCQIRKTEPLQRALAGFDAWFTGRKRFQNSVRAELQRVRGRRRAHQGQSARQLVGRRPQGLCRAPRAARASAGRQGLSRRSAACPAPPGSQPGEDAPRRPLARPRQDRVRHPHPSSRSTAAASDRARAIGP